MRRWESLDASRQFLIAYPLMVLVVSAAHWTFLFQPLERGFLYGLFWAVPAAGLVVIASRNEARKRRAREQGDGDAGDAS